MKLNWQTITAIIAVLLSTAGGARALADQMYYPKSQGMVLEEALKAQTAALTEIRGDMKYMVQIHIKDVTK